MRTVSACALARVQSRLNTAAEAAEFLSSVLREVAIVSSPNCCFRLAFLGLRPSILGNPLKINTRALPPCYCSRRLHAKGAKSTFRLRREGVAAGQDG